jgi:predicted nucleotidyltransferase
MNTGLLHKIQTTLAKEPVLRAWLFGSFARNEETPASDEEHMLKPFARATVEHDKKLIYERKTA